MAYSMYNNKRGHFYDMRNVPYSYYNLHPMEVLEYQRGRPTKLPVRQLNRQFKRTVIPFGDESQQVRSALSVSVQHMPTVKGKQACVVFAQASGHFADATDEAGAVSIPDNLAAQFVQQLRKLAKWKGSNGSSTNPPSGGQGLIFEDQVFKAQIASLPTGDFAIKILAETRARDPQERRELSSVLVPLEPEVLAKLKTALTDLLVTESPLYHTESLQVSDGSKFYLDLIMEESAHYLKVSHVTRDFRSIVIVPAGDVEALRELLDTSLKVMKTQQQPLDDGAGASSGKAAGKRKRGRNNPRRRPATAGQKRRGGAGGSGGRGGSSGSEGKENGETAASPAAADSDSKEEPAAAAAVPTTAGAGELSGEDNSTVESRPVENGDGPVSEKGPAF